MDQLIGCASSRDLRKSKGPFEDASYGCNPHFSNEALRRRSLEVPPHQFIDRRISVPEEFLAVARQSWLNFAELAGIGAAAVPLQPRLDDLILIQACKQEDRAGR